MVKCLIFSSLFLVFSCTKEQKKPEYPGGTWAINVGTTPPTINPTSSTTFDASVIQSFVLEGLLESNPDTLEWKPSLAKSWEVKNNGMLFEFTLRENITWHDGKPFTVEDVKFSFDIIFQDDYPALKRLQPYFENIESPTILSPNKIQFKAKKKYHQNFDVLASAGFFTILPKHIYQDSKNKKRLNKILVGTGPYKLKEIKRGKWALLEKNRGWWGENIPHTAKKNRFGRVIIRFIKGETQSLESFKKQKLSFMSLSPEQYFKKTEGGNWGKKYFKEKVKNQSSKGYGYVGFNLKNKLFQSKKVRKALTHLMNRKLMIQKFLYDLHLPATGPVYQQSPYANQDVKPLAFDPKKALQYLREEGWSDSDNDQILDKIIDGKKRSFSYTLLMPNKDSEKYMTIYKEDSKKAGIDVKLKLVEWNTLVKHLDERSFEAVTLAWSSGSLQWDPKQIWHTDSQGGSNFIGYSNKKVDQLIDLARVTLDRKKRAPILKEVYRLIADDAPYIFLFNREFELYSYQNNLKRPKPTFKYKIGTEYWEMKKDF